MNWTEKSSDRLPVETGFSSSTMNTGNISLLMIFFILHTCLLDNLLILWGEIRYWYFMGVKNYYNQEKSCYTSLAILLVLTSWITVPITMWSTASAKTKHCSFKLKVMKSFFENLKFINVCYTLFILPTFIYSSFWYQTPESTKIKKRKYEIKGFFLLMLSETSLR